MAWVQRLPKLVPGLGSPYQNDTLFQVVGTALSTTGQVANSLTGLTPTLSCGYVRIKIYGAGGTSPTAAFVVVLSDGTNFVQIANFAASPVMSTVASTGSPYTNGGSNTAVAGIERTIPFMVDINVNQLSVLTTLGGTTPTAVLDMEISGTS